jgi:putative transposase
MKYQFIDKYRSVYRVEKMCRILDIGRSSYYTWKKRSRSIRDKENERLVFKIKLVHEKSRRIYGSPRITAELRVSGIRCGKNRVARLMRENEVVAKTMRRFKITTDSKHNLPIAPNLLEQDFTADAPNKTWTGDITYIWTRQGWMYLAVVLDLFNREIAGWSMRKRITKDIVTEALTMAVKRKRPQKGLIFHSDRGSQYASHKFRKLLKEHHFIQSMSGKGNCYESEACPWGIMLLRKVSSTH